MRATDNNERIKEVKNIKCQDLETLSAFLSSLSEYQNFTLEAKELITEFVNRVSPSNKTKSINGGRVLKITCRLKNIQDRSDSECMVIGLKSVFRKLEKDGFDFKKKDPTGYIWAVAKSQKTKRQETEIAKAALDERDAFQKAPEGDSYQSLRSFTEHFEENRGCILESPKSPGTSERRADRKSEGMLEELLTAEKVSKILKVSPSAVFKWAKRGTIPFYRINEKCLRFKKPDIEVFVEKGKGIGLTYRR